MNNNVIQFSKYLTARSAATIVPPASAEIVPVAVAPAAAVPAESGRSGRSAELKAAFQDFDNNRKIPLQKWVEAQILAAQKAGELPDVVFSVKVYKTKSYCFKAHVKIRLTLPVSPACVAEYKAMNCWDNERHHTVYARIYSKICVPMQDFVSHLGNNATESQTDYFEQDFTSDCSMDDVTFVDPALRHGDKPAMKLLAEGLLGL